MNCDHCGSEAITPVHGLNHLQCADCNIVLNVATSERENCSIKPLGKETQFQCPTCSTQSLNVGEIGKAQVCYCPHCLGFVVDNMTLAELIQYLRGQYDGADDRPVMMDATQLHVQRSCPACHEAMETHPYHGPGNVIIDSCRNCKLNWMDHDELGKIIRSPGRR